MNKDGKPLPQYLIAVFCILLFTLPAAGQSLGGLRLGNQPSNVDRSRWKLVASDATEVIYQEKYRDATDLLLAVSYDKRTRAAVDIELDLEGTARGQEVPDLPNLRFGLTTLYEVRGLMGSNGFAYESVGGVIKDEDGLVSLNFYQVEERPNTAIMFATAMPYSIVQEKQSTTDIAALFMLAGVRLVDTEYLDSIWGAAKTYDPNNKSVRWAAIKLGTTSNSESASLKGDAGPCQLTLAQAPEIGGIRLGSSFDDVARLLPSIRSRHRSDFTPDKTGLTGRIGVPVVNDEEEVRFAGVSSLNFMFLDNRVAYFDLNYKNDGTWKFVEDFASHISKRLSLPGEWQAKSRTEKSISCGEFEVSVEVLAPIVTNVAFNDLLAEQVVARRAGAVKADRSSPTTASQPATQPNNARSDGSPVAFKELKSFQRDGEAEVWKNILVTPAITKEQLIALAKYLYQLHPRTRFNIFDDEKEFQSFVDWRLHFYEPDRDRYPWPQVWLRNHHLAMINRMSPAEPGTLGWVLFAQDGGGRFRDESGRRLAILE